MTPWGTAFLGIMAGALVLSTVMQVALIYIAVRALRAAQGQLLIVERQITPLLEHATVIAGHLEHSTKMASAQLERLDSVITGATLGLASARGALRAVSGSVAGVGAVTTVLKGFTAWRRRRATRTLPGRMGI